MISLMVGWLCVVGCLCRTPFDNAKIEGIVARGAGPLTSITSMFLYSTKCGSCFLN